MQNTISWMRTWEMVDWVRSLNMEMVDQEIFNIRGLKNMIDRVPSIGYGLRE